MHFFPIRVKVFCRFFLNPIIIKFPTGEFRRSSLRFLTIVIVSWRATVIIIASQHRPTKQILEKTLWNVSNSNRGKQKGE